MSDDGTSNSGGYIASNKSHGSVRRSTQTRLNLLFPRMVLHDWLTQSTESQENAQRTYPLHSPSIVAPTPPASSPIPLTTNRSPQHTAPPSTATSVAPNVRPTPPASSSRPPAVPVINRSLQHTAPPSTAATAAPTVRPTPSATQTSAQANDGSARNDPLHIRIDRGGKNATFGTAAYITKIVWRIKRKSQQDTRIICGILDMAELNVILQAA